MAHLVSELKRSAVSKGVVIKEVELGVEPINLTFPALVDILAT